MTANRVFGVPPGGDFCATLVDGLLDRFGSEDPIALAGVWLIVNTRRTGRRIAELVAQSGARLLPRIVPVADLGSGLVVPGVAPAVPALRRRLQLSRIVMALLDRQPDLAPRSAAFDLADSLAALIDEMHEERVGPEAFLVQDFGEMSEHWERTLAVLKIVTRYFGPGAGAAPTAAARLDLVVEHLAATWAADPPMHPVIVAGSTGSRGTTLRLMGHVAGLAQGALVLPGFDFGLSESIWQTLTETRAEDHPQYRFAALLQRLHLDPAEVRPWSGALAGTPGNRLVSLALRPAPVTDQWIAEGPRLADLDAATERLTLIEAPNHHAEALAIAIALREAVANDEVAALVTPDRILTRRVAAELGRWGIVPDDSAGEPLALTPPGRLLRHALDILVAPATAETLLATLKHPLVHAGPSRGRHLDRTRALELKLRRDGRPNPVPDDLVEAVEADDAAWRDWLVASLFAIDRPQSRPLADHVRHHIALAELLAGGPAGDAGALWSGRDGLAALAAMRDLEREADHGGDLTATEYRDLAADVLARGEAPRTPVASSVRFWGTLEARVQGADLVILGGLNEGVWPGVPPPDPWLSRSQRLAVGLTLPERRIGLSAHDFQQAISARRAILSRSLRDESADTVPSRWLGRLTNLLAGLPGPGVAALDGMTARGDRLLALARLVDTPQAFLPPARRPAPRPPVGSRPRSLSVTEIQTLIRDPYAIYARHILCLRPLDPIRPLADAPLKGTVIHDVLQQFVAGSRDDGTLLTVDRLMAIADEALARDVHWPGIRHLWRARIEAFAPWFVAGERNRRDQGIRPALVETKAVLRLADPDFTLVGKPDRIDILADGSAEIVDYKSGQPPTGRELLHFDRQLGLLGLMVAEGAFALGRLPVAFLTHFGLGKPPKAARVAVGPAQVIALRDELGRLIRAFDDPHKGYPSKRATEGQRWDGDYDHLARFGEWATSDPATGEDVG